MLVGEVVKVKVKFVEKDFECIFLFIKDILLILFENIKGKFYEDDVIEGIVVCLVNFGVFVEIVLFV